MLNGTQPLFGTLAILAIGLNTFMKLFIVAVSVQPAASVVVSFTAKLPLVEYVLLGVCKLLVLPSPKSHSQLKVLNVKFLKLTINGALQELLSSALNLTMGRFKTVNILVTESVQVG